MNGISTPYVGPRTFERGESAFFFGREREASDLLGLIKFEQLLLFYAQSGAGKSSLINARIIPGLERDGFVILPVGRLAGELPGEAESENPYVYNLVRSLIPRSSDPTSLDGYSLTEALAGLSDRDEAGAFFSESPLPDIDPEGEEGSTRRRALLIDQFEELFTTHPEAWEKREDFFRQLAQAMRDHPALSILLVMREDFLGNLDPYAHLLPNRLRARYYMQRLGHAAALQAVKGPVANIRPFAEGVAEKLVDDLSSMRILKADGMVSVRGQFIEPVQLQVVCYSLWQNLPDGDSAITEEHLYQVGDVNASLQGYYASRVREVAILKNIAERLIREWFGRELITAGGVRNLVVRQLGTQPGRLPDDVIQEFARRADLVRAEQRGGATFYELIHDRFVEPILENNRAWFAAHASLLQMRADQWELQGRPVEMLLHANELKSAIRDAGPDPQVLSLAEREFLAESIKAEQQEQRERRGSFLARGMAIAALILAILAIFILTSAQVPQRVIGYILVALCSLLFGFYLGRNMK